LANTSSALPMTASPAPSIISTRGEVFSAGITTSWATISAPAPAVSATPAS
jgi:hypothetical protein